MKTLRLFMLTAVVMCPFVASAQDIIVKNDGSTIASKVMEITGAEIKYKKYSNLKGPIYIINKTDVSYINYENGERESFGRTSNVAQIKEETYSTQSKLTLQQANNTLASDAELLKNVGKSIPYKKAKQFKTIGWVGGATFVVAGIVLNLLHDDGGDYYGDYYAVHYAVQDCLDIIGYASFGAGVVWTTSFLMASNRQKKKALYSANTSTPLMQFSLSQSKNSAIYANVNVLNDNMTNRKTLGLGMNINF